MNMLHCHESKIAKQKSEAECQLFIYFFPLNSFESYGYQMCFAYMWTSSNSNQAEPEIIYCGRHTVLLQYFTLFKRKVTESKVHLT